MSEIIRNLRIIEKAIENHSTAYQNHELAVQEHKLDINKLELDLSLMVEGSEYDERQRKEHQRHSQKHLLQKEEHQRLKLYHYTLAGLITQLRRTLEEEPK